MTTSENQGPSAAVSTAAKAGSQKEQKETPRARHNRETADGKELAGVFLLGRRDYQYVGKKVVRVEATEKGYYHGRIVKRGEVLELSREGERLGRWMRVLKDGEESSFVPAQQKRFPTPLPKPPSQ